MYGSMQVLTYINTYKHTNKLMYFKGHGLRILLSGRAHVLGLARLNKKKIKNSDFKTFTTEIGIGIVSVTK